MALGQVMQIGPRQKAPDTTIQRIGQIGGTVAGALVGGLPGAAAGMALGGALGEAVTPEEDHSVSLRGAIESMRSQPEPMRREFSQPLVEAYIKAEGAKVPRAQQQSTAISRRAGGF